MRTLKLITASTLVAMVAFGLSAGAAVKKKTSKMPDIYHKDWIDFNKNGVKDIFEDPAQPVDARVENLLGQMNVEEKTCQLTTLYGSGRVLRDSLPTPQWKDRIWKDGIANIDEQLNGVGRGARNYPHLIYPFSNFFSWIFSLSVIY